LRLPVDGTHDLTPLAFSAARNQLES
jgi:hypothetical protein